MIDNRIFNEEDIKKYTHALLFMKYKGLNREEFKQIIFHGEYIPYLVSNYGRVMSVNYGGKKDNPKILKHKIQDNGYVSLQISFHEHSYTVLVHRLVATAFIPNPENKPEVNHKDGIKTHNHYSNLEWATRKENDDHALKHGLKKIRYGEDIGNNVNTKTQVEQVCVLLTENKLSIKDISKVTGVSYDMVRHILNGESWRSVSDKYDFSKYTYGDTQKNIDNKIQNIHKVCKLLETNQYTLNEISSLTGIKFGMICKIKNKECYVNISKNYKIEIMFQKVRIVKSK